MNNVERGVREILSTYSRYTFDQISLTANLDKYMEPTDAARIGRELERKFRNIPRNSITNLLMTDIKTVEKLIAKISQYYKNL